MSDLQKYISVSLASTLSISSSIASMDELLSQSNRADFRGRPMRNFLIGFLGGAICFIVAIVVGIGISKLLPIEGQAYVGIGLESRNLPGTILGILAWIGFAVFASRKFPRK